MSCPFVIRLTVSNCILSFSLNLIKTQHTHTKNIQRLNWILFKIITRATLTTTTIKTSLFGANANETTLCSLEEQPFSFLYLSNNGSMPPSPSLRSPLRSRRLIKLTGGISKTRYQILFDKRDSHYK